MQIIIKATQIELTPSMTAYVEDRIKPLEKYIERFEEGGEAIARVELARTTQHHRHGDVFCAEVNLTVDGEVIRATREGEEMYAVIDDVKDVLKSELQKFKELRVEKPVADAQRGGE